VRVTLRVLRRAPTHVPRAVRDATPARARASTMCDAYDVDMRRTRRAAGTRTFARCRYAPPRSIARRRVQERHASICQEDVPQPVCLFYFCRRRLLRYFDTFHYIFCFIFSFHFIAASPYDADAAPIFIYFLCEQPHAPYVVYAEKYALLLSP